MNVSVEMLRSSYIEVIDNEDKMKMADKAKINLKFSPNERGI